MDMGRNKTNGLLSVETKSRHRGEMERGDGHTHRHTQMWYPEAADTVVTLVHDLVVNSAVAITESCHCNGGGEWRPGGAQRQDSLVYTNGWPLLLLRLREDRINIFYSIWQCSLCCLDVNDFKCQYYRRPGKLCCAVIVSTTETWDSDINIFYHVLQSNLLCGKAH